MKSLPDNLEKKRLAALAWLRARGRYILDRGTPPPKWGSQKREKEKCPAPR